MRALIGLRIDPAAGPVTDPTLYHLFATLIAGGIWLAGRWTTLSLTMLKTLDAAGTFLMCTLYALMAGSFSLVNVAAIADPMHAMFIGLLACTYVLISRAISLPSTPACTAWVSTGAMVPMVTVGQYILRLPGTAAAVAAAGTFDITSWSIAAVAMAAISSRVIFGLRTEVSQIRTLGQYTLESKIGEGGMGVVYRARHALLRRPTAIKILPPDKAGEENVRRFEREVQLTARLSHPSTIAIFDYGRTPEGLFYYAMEYLDGLTLEQLVHLDGPQPAGRVIHILQQVSGALAEAHDVGLIHRDIKPGNIILSERGGMPDIAKVVDFGLVKRFERTDDDSTIVVTAANVVVGTPLYLPPEVLGGDFALDARSDLYALGAVAYFLLVGSPVFQAKTVVEVFAHHLHTAPTPPSERAEQAIPPDLDRITLQCLAKNPADRPRDARTLERALAQCATSTPWSSETARRWWQRFKADREEMPASSSDATTVPVDRGHRVAL